MPNLQLMSSNIHKGGERLKILQRMLAHTQFCWPGDNTIEAGKPGKPPQNPMVYRFIIIDPVKWPSFGYTWFSDIPKWGKNTLGSKQFPELPGHKLGYRLCFGLSFGAFEHAVGSQIASKVQWHLMKSALCFDVFWSSRWSLWPSFKSALRSLMPCLRTKRIAEMRKRVAPS